MPKLSRATVKAGAQKDIEVGKDEKGEPITVTIRALSPEEFFDLLPDQNLDLEDMSTKDTLKLMRGENGKPGIIKELMVRACVDPKVSLEPQPQDSPILHVNELARFSMSIFEQVMAFSGFGKNGARAFRAEPAGTDGGDGGAGVRPAAK